MIFTIWTNGIFSETATRLLEQGTCGHRLVTSTGASHSVLNAGEPDAVFAQADIALGQPCPTDCLNSGRLRWLEVTSAGYTRYDTDEFMESMAGRNVCITNASSVFADPCAQHVLGMMLAFGRQLLPSYRDQLADHSWHYHERRYQSRLLTGQTVLLLGFGAIGRRIAQLLAPFDVRLIAVRRRVVQTTGVEVVSERELPNALAYADHVINILPANASTEGFMSEERFSMLRPNALFYNVGRGVTVDQGALIGALTAGRLAGAYLDVMDPEPLPADHELWTTPNCYITPHTAGGRHDQDEELVRHFLANLARYEKGETLIDRVI
jgi:phosphoglycerate dehydrogenase-like enzyme